MAPMNPEVSADLVALTVKQVLEDGNTDTRIVVLKSEDASVTLPIWVGAPKEMRSASRWNMRRGPVR